MGIQGVRWDVWNMEAKPGFFRLDGTEIAPTWPVADKLTAESLKAVKALVAKELPDFTWGYNFGSPEENKNIPLSFDEKCAGGGWILDEVMITYMSKTSPFHTWPAYSQSLLTWGDTVRKKGGVYDPWMFYRGYSEHGIAEVDWLYTTIFRILSGGRVWNQLYKCESSRVGDLPLLAFRYSNIYSGMSLDLQDEKTQKLVSVTGPDTVWWKGYVFKNKGTDGKDQVIVHLVNAPVIGEAESNPDSKVPAPVLAIDVAVFAQNGKMPKKAYLVMAEPVKAGDPVKVQAVELTIVNDKPGIGHVIVPSLLYLKSVVFEF
jgi:hypothetical protein